MPTANWMAIGVFILLFYSHPAGAAEQQRLRLFKSAWISTVRVCVSSCKNDRHGSERNL
jgi:hypothetical protein